MKIIAICDESENKTIDHMISYWNQVLSKYNMKPDTVLCE